MRIRQGVRAWSKDLGLLALAAIGLLALAELALRYWLPPWAEVVPFDRSARLLGVEDACEHPWAAGRSNVWTLAVIGDSIAMGVGNQKCHRLAFVLEWFLNVGTSAPPAQVRLYAKPSSTYQQIGDVRRAIADGASVVVLAISLNDTEDWSRPAELMANRPDRGEWSGPRWLRAVARQSRLVGVTWRAVERDRRLAGYLQYYRFLYHSGYSGLEKFRTALREIRAAADDGGAQVAAVLFPLLIADLRPGRYPFEAMHEVVAAACREAGIPLLDLRAAMAGSTPDRLQAIPMVDAHGSEVAHRIAAEEIFYFLLDLGVLDPRRRPMHVRELDRWKTWAKKFDALGQPLEGRSAWTAPRTPRPVSPEPEHELKPSEEAHGTAGVVPQRTSNER